MLSLLLSIIILTSAVGNVILGFLVFSRNPKGRINITFAAIALFAAVWALGLFFFEHPVYFSSNVWLRFVYIIAMIIIGLLLYFSYTFPRKTEKPYIVLMLIHVLPAIGLTYTLIFTNLFVVDVVRETWGYRQILGPAFIVFGIWGTFVTLWAIFNYLISHRKSSGLQKAQLRYLFLGFFLFVAIPIVLDVFFPLVLKDSRFIWFSPISTFFLVGFLAYAIIKHRLMDIRLIVARSVTYLLLITTLGLFYAVGLFFVGSFIIKEPATSLNLATSTTLALIMAFSFQPLRRFFEKVTEKAFYKDRYSTDELLHSFSQTMAFTIDLDDLACGIIALLLREMHILKAAFFVLDAKGVTSAIYKDRSTDYSYPKIDQLKKMGTDQILVFEELEEGEAKQIMRENELSVFIPLKTEKQLVGYLLLGGKSSGDIYYEQDLKALEILAPEFAVALQNAQAYREIQEFSHTLEKKVEERTRELKETQIRELAKAKELLRLKDEFVFIATHDLRTPVTAISGYIDLIRETKQAFSEDTKESFQAIERASERLEQLISDLLQVARSESGTIKVEVSPLDLVKLTQTTIKQATPAAGKRNITINSELDQNNRLVLADEEKLAEVMENLLSNAIKFNREGGRIEVKSAKIDSTLQVSVTDTGYGISKEQQGKVFQKFFRARVEATKKVPGTGLGLFVVRMLIEKMGGKITFVSEENKGTTFTFTLPLVNTAVS